MPADVSAVVVTLDARPWIERCLDSVRSHETIVVDVGSTDGTPELVRGRFPDAQLVEIENRGLAAGWNEGIRRASGRYVLILNADAWMLDDAIEKLAAFADAHPEAAVVAPRSSALNAFYAGGFEHDTVREAEFVMGAVMLVRREAINVVGPLDEDFFLFSEETDWHYRFERAGWKVFFTPDAEAVHVGGASHGGRFFVEQITGHLRFLAKHRGLREAERARRLLLVALRLRGAAFRGERGRIYREAAARLASGPVRELLRR